MTGTRIRQLVFASREQNDIALLKNVLGLGTEYVDPGVAEFGLTNGVFALGDQFLEVVVPTEENTAAGRFLDRNGDLGGYMIIFQSDDLGAVRSRADALHIRRVWNIDLQDISASHLHPGDIGAAIVSIDEAKPEGSWRWGGPSWQDNSRAGAIIGAEVSAREPEAIAERWAGVLGVRFSEKGPGYRIELDGGGIDVVPGAEDRLTAFHLAVDKPQDIVANATENNIALLDKNTLDLIGVRVTLSAH